MQETSARTCVHMFEVTFTIARFRDCKGTAALSTAIFLPRAPRAATVTECDTTPALSGLRRVVQRKLHLWLTAKSAAVQRPRPLPPTASAACAHARCLRMTPMRIIRTRDAMKHLRSSPQCIHPRRLSTCACCPSASAALMPHRHTTLHPLFLPAPLTSLPAVHLDVDARLHRGIMSLPSLTRFHHVRSSHAQAPPPPPPSRIVHLPSPPLPPP